MSANQYHSQEWAEAVILKARSSKSRNLQIHLLLSKVYKLLSKIIIKRITRKLDEYQPPEQKELGTSINTYDQPPSMRIHSPIDYIEYEKAFVDKYFWAVIGELHCRIDSKS